MEIKTVTGAITIIDEEDADLAEYPLWIVNRRYVRIKVGENIFPLHRVILERIEKRTLNKFEKTDHINRNSLDNRRQNLRVATTSQNSVNCLKSHRNTSGYKGVNFIKGRWRATVGNKHIGVFDNPIDAARAYDAVMIEKYGEFAYLNFPDDVSKFKPNILRRDNTSGYRGIYKVRNKWSAEFQIKGKKYRLSGFSTPQDAAIAYDNLAKQHLGDNAKLNFP